MRRWTTLLLLALLALPMAPGAQAQPTTAPADGPRLQAILASGTLRVGLTGDYKPFSIVDPAAPEGMSGLDVDMAESLAHSLGVKLDVVKTSWATLMPDLLANKFDIALGGITVTLARARTAFFSDPVMKAGKAAIARCADTAKYQSLAAIDRPDVRVIANPGGTNESFDHANLHQAQIVLFPDNAKIFDALAAGQADVMITDGVETLLQAKLHPGVLCAIHPDQPFNTSDLAYMMPQDPAWQEYVNLWLHQSDTSGEHRRIIAKYLD